MFDLPTEEEIIAKWSEGATTPLVSIECITYNHGEYIEKALRGFLSQRTNFAFEVLVHDDASNDDTAEIVRRYERKYPRIIRAVYQQENQYSQGKWPDDILAEMYRGKYVAICEGDDYWSDPCKLAKQVEVLNNDPRCNLCFHSARKINYKTGEDSIMGRYREGSGMVPVQDIIEKKYGQIPTASLMMRVEVVHEVREFIKQLSYQKVADVYLQIIGAIKGEAYYIDEVMSVYHCFIPGSWSADLLADYNTMLEHVESKIISYEMLDEMSGYKYSDSFRYVNAKWVSVIMRSLEIPGGIKKEFFYDYAHYLNTNERVLAFLFMKLPGLLKLSKKMKKFFLRQEKIGATTA